MSHHLRTPSILQRISISDTFDGGNVKLTEVAGDSHKRRVKLRIRRDAYTELEAKHHYQFFCFRVMINDLAPNETTEINYVIENAGSVSFPVAWEGSTVFYTHNLMDPNSWRRNLSTTYEDGEMTWTHEHSGSGHTFFSYFPTFSYAQHLELISKCQQQKAAEVRSLGQTLEGREVECVSVGAGDRVCWIIHRQHPGETMGEYYAEGLLTRLLGFETNGEVDGNVRRALSLYRFYIVPCMCPDGVVAGFLRTNSCGANLNREWSNYGDYEAPSLERSPEVLAVWKKMQETGVDCFLDVHGDEELPFNFLVGAEKSKNWGPRLEALHGAFVGAYIRANNDMQREVGYEPPEDESQAQPNEATNAVANRYDCLSVTLEMPFKDCLTNPDPRKGWSPNRSRMLGASVIEALMYVHPYLRTEQEFWHSLPEDDRYVTPTSEYRKYEE